LLLCHARDVFAIDNDAPLIRLEKPDGKRERNRFADATRPRIANVSPSSTPKEMQSKTFRSPKDLDTSMNSMKYDTSVL
jgi:hypothetical protein